MAGFSNRWRSNMLSTLTGSDDGRPTHGLAILNRLRHHVPSAESVLMDADTLLANRPLWVREEKPHRALLPMLTASEQQVYDLLLANQNVRLEQERLPWADVEVAFSF